VVNPAFGFPLFPSAPSLPVVSYEVRDVVGEFIWNADSSWSKDVVVILVKENPDKPSRLTHRRSLAIHCSNARAGMMSTARSIRST
jgi:hypothetical protein